jgi:hypothetical protein
MKQRLTTHAFLIWQMYRLSMRRLLLLLLGVVVVGAAAARAAAVPLSVLGAGPLYGDADCDFSADVVIGGQTFRLIMDSGSSFPAVASSTCTPATGCPANVTPLYPGAYTGSFTAVYGSGSITGGVRRPPQRGAVCLSVCECVCVYVCELVFVYVPMCVYVCTRLSLYLRVCVCVCVRRD